MPSVIEAALTRMLNRKPELISGIHFMTVSRMPGRICEPDACAAAQDMADADESHALDAAGIGAMQKAAAFLRAAR